MNIKSTLLYVTLITLVAAFSYYTGVSGRNVNSEAQQSTHTVVETTPLPQKNVVDIPNIEECAALNTSPAIPEQDYQSNIKNQRVLTGADAKPPTPGVITDPIQQNDPGRARLPSPPKDVLEDFNLRHKLYQDMAKTEYEVDMANAGAVNGQPGNPFLVQNARHRYTLNSMKIARWRREIEEKFRVVNSLETFTEKEKRLLREKMVRQAGDPISVPRYEKVE